LPESDVHETHGKEARAHVSASGMSSGTVLGRADLKHSSAVGWTHYPPVGFEAPQPIVPSSALLALLRAAELDEMELGRVS